MDDLRDFQARLACSQSNLNDWDIVGDYASLVEVISNAKPDVLIGVSGQAGLFTEEVIKTLLNTVQSPSSFRSAIPRAK